MPRALCCCRCCRCCAGKAATSSAANQLQAARSMISYAEDVAQWDFACVAESPAMPQQAAEEGAAEPAAAPAASPTADGRAGGEQPQASQEGGAGGQAEDGSSSDGLSPFGASCQQQPQRTPHSFVIGDQQLLICSGPPSCASSGGASPADTASPSASRASTPDPSLQHVVPAPTASRPAAAAAARKQGRFTVIEGDYNGPPLDDSAFGGLGLATRSLGRQRSASSPQMLSTPPAGPGLGAPPPEAGPLPAASGAVRSPGSSGGRQPKPALARPPARSAGSPGSGRAKPVRRVSFCDQQLLPPEPLPQQQLPPELGASNGGSRKLSLDAAEGPPSAALQPPPAPAQPAAAGVLPVSTGALPAWAGKAPPRGCDVSSLSITDQQVGVAAQPQAGLQATALAPAADASALPAAEEAGAGMPHVRSKGRFRIIDA